MHAETAMGTSDRIEVNPEIMLGKPVIRGTRITVELLLRALAGGVTEADLLEAYPHLTQEDLKAAIAYAADAVGRERETLPKDPGQKPTVPLFKGPGDSTGRLIGESGDQPAVGSA